MPADRVTLAELRKMAKQALGKEASVREVQYDGHLAIARIPALVEVTTVGPTSMAARRQLRDLLERIIAGSGTDEYDRGYRDGKGGR